MTKYIAWITAILVSLVAIGSFALSYNALQGVAIDNGIPVSLSYIWPLLIDFSLIVFSLCAITSYLYGESTWKQWMLVGGYTLATIAFNAIHAYPQVLSPIAIKLLVTCVPPLSLFLSFEILMAQLKNSVIRSNVQQSLSQLITVYTERQQQLEQVYNMVDTLQQKLLSIQEQIDSLNAPKDEVVIRRDKLLSLMSNDIKSTQKQLAEELGVSIQTVRSDIKALNGVLK